MPHGNAIMRAPWSWMILVKHFLIPALLVFPNIWGLLGIQIAQPVADICTLVLCIAIVNGILRQLKAKEDLA